MNVFLLKMMIENNTIWDKVSVDIKKELDSVPVYNNFFLKSKIISHDDGITDFYDKEIPKANSVHTCLTVISLDSALRKDEIYFLQVFLKQGKFIENKVIRHINDNLNYFSSSDESD